MDSMTCGIALISIVLYAGCSNRTVHADSALPDGQLSDTSIAPDVVLAPDLPPFSLSRKWQLPFINGHIHALAAGPTGNIHAAGVFQKSVTIGGFEISGQAAFDGFVASVQPEGKVRWSAALLGPSVLTTNGVAVDDSRNVYAVGRFYKSVTSGKVTTTLPANTFPPNGGFVASYSRDGEVRWIVHVPAFVLTGVAAGTEGRVYVTGVRNVPTGCQFVAALDQTAGTEVWSHEAVGKVFQDGASVAVDSVGNVFAAGTFADQLTVGGKTLVSQGESDVFVVGYTADGEMRWTKAIGDGGADRAAAITTGPGGSVFLAAEHETDWGVVMPAATQARGFIVKLDTLGEQRWSRQLDGIDLLHGIAVSAAGHVFVAGAFWESVTLGQVKLSNPGKRNSVIAALDAGGSPLWGDNPGPSSARAVATFGDNVYVSSPSPGLLTKYAP